ncbi:MULTISPECIES: DUF2513 domain-containing protein [unclassified Pseudomonas]|uniref:DUF2513 domain-containing protein n=1 Tax=unclassified Pseudomonas TaxID=196821 RepID=UPI0015A1E1FE|nr:MULTISPECIES: DUF2513 domain-containing protein [unclassified Pseudomonas]NWC95769.1 DUF2513 domain-containing protein [Pseudomonas sp. IPO3779]NWD20283.1 DUF2513 domain-containing protein [Pseudomonas sp. IPO3778]
MKRDMELVRKLLFFFESKSEPEYAKTIEIDGYSELLIRYHCALMYDAGLLFAEPVKSSTSDRVIYVLPFELSWAGHEFLDGIRSDSTWNKIKDHAMTNGLALSFMIISESAKTYVLKKLSLG